MLAAVCLKLTPVVQLYYSSGIMEVSLARTWLLLMKWVTTLDSAMTQVVMDPMWLSSVFDLRKHEIALHDYTKSSLYYSQEKKKLEFT